LVGDNGEVRTMAHVPGIYVTRAYIMSSIRERGRG
jgi:hypothetical protein